MDFSSQFHFSDTRSIIAQIVGFVPLAFAFLTFLLKERKHILLTKLTSDLLWSVHFFLLLQYTGALINAVNTVRDAILYHRDKRWASHISLLFVFAAFTVGATLIRWQGAYSILPLIGSLLALIGFWCNDPRTIKRLNLPAVLLWLIYGFIVGSLSTVLCNILSAASIIISEINEYKRRPSAIERDQ